MNIFTDQINARRQNDSAMFDGAFATLASVLDKQHLRQENIPAIDSALAKVLKSIGLSTPEIPNKIRNADERIEYVLRATGAMRRRVELKGAWWRAAGGSLLGSTVDGDVIAITESGISGYRYTGSSGESVKVNKKSAENINADAFYFYRPFPAGKMTQRDLVIFMLKNISRGDIAFVVCATFLVTAVGLLMPFFNKQIFDFVIPAGIKSNIFPMAVLLIGVALGSALFTLTRSILLARFKDRLSLTVQSALMGRLFSLPAGFFKDYSAGELARRTMSINVLIEALSTAVLTVGLTLLFSTAYVFQMMYYTPTLVSPGIIVSFCALAFSVMIGFKKFGVSRKMMMASAKLSGLTYMLFSGVQKIRLTGAEKRAFSKWADMYGKSAALEYTPPVILRVGDVIATTISLLGSLAIYYYAGATQVSPADYMAFFVAFGAVNSAILALGGTMLKVAEVGPAIEMIKPILETEPEKNNNRKIVKSLSGSLEINGLTFRYNKDGPPILDNFSLKVKRGEYVAIVGKTGCGKSTLMRLLLGFEEPEIGAIYYDGSDLKTLDLTSVRQNIGVCLQNGQLFFGDIFSNIVITAPHKTLDDAWVAANMAGLNEDIKAMPMGMHTMISEGGGGVSGGQKQRLLIARALVKKPKILFFDEATSALDNITQKHISDNISSLKCTRLVIAHRLSTIKQASRIIVLDGGKITEDGDYETLMNKRGGFYELAKRQII
ncbi:MAG: NHLP bacteriocin export ABC transporter permease/ATPase subunit [Chitinispirillales bacterium]|jgi:NHLM bacteriocin system ABC transporter ATP-binding protein|nr:NHLP bacteriocin export ABC transporter permease/ATPase subunit [Chitinispirillales bacterium]